VLRPLLLLLLLLLALDTWWWLVALLLLLLLQLTGIDLLELLGALLGKISARNLLVHTLQPVGAHQLWGLGLVLQWTGNSGSFVIVMRR
jgi:hypothetical protein